MDNTGDGRPDVSYRYQFKTRIKNKNSFLYALPGANGYDDPKLNVVQRYSIVREDHHWKKGKDHERTQTIARDLPVAPPNIGPKTFPSYEHVRGRRDQAAGRRHEGLRRPARRSVLRGPGRDVRRPERPQAHRQPGPGQGRPERDEHPCGGHADPGGQRDQERQVRLRSGARATRSWASGPPPSAGASTWSTAMPRRPEEAPQKGRRSQGSNGWVQVSRLGNPLVNEVVIPLGQKDRFNRTTPDRDADALRQVRREARARGDPQCAVQRRRPGDRPHGHRAGAAPGHPRPEPAQGDQGPAGGRHDQAQPRRAACERRREPVRRDRRRHRRVPERPQARRRRRGHRAPGRGRVPEGQQGPAGRRGGQERQAVPVHVPLPGRARPAASTRIRPTGSSRAIRRCRRAAERFHLGEGALPRDVPSPGEAIR